MAVALRAAAAAAAARPGRRRPRWSGRHAAWLVGAAVASAALGSSSGVMRGGSFAGRGGRPGVRSRTSTTSVRAAPHARCDEPILGLADVVEDLQRQRVHPLREVELGAEDEGGGEQQRRGLAGRAGDGEQRAGDEAGQRGRQHDAEDDPPARRAERERGLAQASGTRFSTTSAERVTTGSMSSASATEPFQPANVPPIFVDDEDDVDEEAEDDRRHAGHHVDEVAHDVGERALLAVLDEVEGDADAERDRDQRWPARRSRSCR